jgi:hypothetical protein
MQSNFIFLIGAGASPEGERPFLDRLYINTLESKRFDFRTHWRAFILP